MSFRGMPQIERRGCNGNRGYETQSTSKQTSHSDEAGGSRISSFAKRKGSYVPFDMGRAEILGQSSSSAAKDEQSECRVLLCVRAASPDSRK